MADNISGIRHIGPPVPLRPVQPSNKDREPNERQKKDQRKPNPGEHHDNDKPTIDEHV
jgi:hypothetical protein